MGSIWEGRLKEILDCNWKDNEFLNALNKSSVYSLYLDYIRSVGKNFQEKKDFKPCNMCFDLRKDKNFLKHFRFREKYKMGKLNFKKYKEIIGDANKIGVKNLIFSDEGEPFLDFKKLVKIVKFSDKKFDNIIIFTNAFFATNEKRTEKILVLLKECGMTHLVVSWENNSKYRFHGSFIPFQKIQTLIKIAKKVGIPVQISYSLLKGSNIGELQELITEHGFKVKTSEFSIIDEIIRFLELATGTGIKGDRNIIWIHPIRLNPRVEAKIDKGDLMDYKPFKSKIMLETYFEFKKNVTKNFRECFTWPLILSNGLVVCCNSNAY
jgi:molybdenum cofactor biosynthesis enzyme MoaA